MGTAGRITKFPSPGRGRVRTYFVDDSGDPGLGSSQHVRKYPYFINGFCYCTRPKILVRNMIRLRDKLHKDGTYSKKLPEIKFHPTRALKGLGCSDREIERDWQPHFDSVRRQIADVVMNSCDGVFAGAVHKTPDMHKKWASGDLSNTLFRQSLLRYVLPGTHRSDPANVIYDRGRLSQYKTRMFNQRMLDVNSAADSHERKYLASINDFYDEDSKKSPGIWAADFVAGAFYHALNRNDPTYRDLLRSKFIGRGQAEIRL